MSADRLQLDDFVLLGRIGDGPGAVTYSALDRRDGRKVIVRHATEGVAAAESLRRETEILSRVRHPNVVRLIESGQSDGLPYCVLAREEGMPLDELPTVWRAAMGQRTLLELLGPLLDALAEIHEAGFMHGDLSPRNILLRRDGQPVLLDLGAAEPLQAEPGEGGVPAAATPGFAAPERGVAGRQGPWSDLYALAAVAYWLVVGRAPPAERPEGGPLSLAAAGDRRFSGDFLGAVDRALCVSERSRPASAAAWRSDLFAAAEPERPEAPTLAQLAGAIREEDTTDLPPADNVPPTALLPHGAAGVPLRAPRSKRAGAVQGTQALRRRRGRGVAAAVALLVIAAAGGAAGWWGWTWYRDAIKQAWLVDPAGGGDTVSVGEAVARAPAGATIRIRPGLYAESLALERPVHLEALAENGAPVVISPVTGACIVLGAPSGSIRGLAFEGGNGATPCLEIAAGAMEVVGNRLGPWSGTGLLIRDAAVPAVRENRFVDIDGTAIVIEGRGGGFIEENEIERTSKSAVKVQAGADPTVRANRILRAGQAGLLIEQGSSGHYSENEIVESAASAIEVRGGAAPRVAANRIEASAQAGLFIHEGARGEYLDNVVLNSKLAGVVVAGGAAPLLSNNEIANGEQHGVLVVGGAGGRIEGNRITGNSGHGIVLGGAGPAVVEDNELKGNRRPQVRRLSQ